MRKYLIFLICLWPLVVIADVDTFVGQTGIDTWVGQTGVDTVVGQTIAAGGGGLSGDYFTCDFSGSTSWTNENVCANDDEFTNTSGTTGLDSGGGYITANAWGSSYGCKQFTNTNDDVIHVKVKLKVDDVDSGAGTWAKLLIFYDGGSGGQQLGALVLDRNDQTMYFNWSDVSGDNSGDTTATLSASTDYWLCMDIYTDSANGYNKLWVSTDSTCDSGDYELDGTTLDTDGFGDHYIDTVCLGTYVSGGDAIRIDYDDLEVDDDTSYGTEP